MIQKNLLKKFTDYGIHLPLALSCIILVTFFLYPSILNEIVSNINIFDESRKLIKF